MKKNKKLLLALGTAATIIAPIATIVSCGSESSTPGTGGTNPGGSSFPDISQASEIKIDDLDKVTADSLIAEFIKEGKYNTTEEAKEAINKITPADLSAFSDNSLAAGESFNTLTLLQSTLLKWAFDNNGDKTLMTGLVNWLDKSGLVTFASESLGRGPWITDDSQGAVSYIRHDFLDAKYAQNFTGYDLSSSSFVKDTPNDENAIYTYNAIPDMKKGDKIFDPSFQKGSSFIDTAFSNASFSIFRTKVVGKDKPSYSDNGELSWETQAQTTHELFKGLKVSLGANGSEIADTDTATNATDLKNLINGDKTADSIIFKNSAVSVNYAKAQNGDVVDSGDAFKARDLFQGFVRSLYSTKSMRDNAIYDGIDVSAYLPKFTPEEEAKWEGLFENKAAADAYTNPNAYLMGLYGVDLKATLKANMDTNAADEEFKLIFKADSLKDTSVNYFIDNIAISPKHLKTSGVTALKANKLANVFDDLELSEGSVESDNATALEGVYSLAPYVMTSYETAEGSKETIKLSPSYIDSDADKAKRQIKEYTTIVPVSGLDATASQQSRKKAFQDAGTTTGKNEFILDPNVSSETSLVKDLTEWKEMRKPSRTGVAPGSNMAWGINGYTDTQYNDLGRKMVYGVAGIDNIKTNPDAVESFFSGDGAKVRDSIKAAINWYTMAQTIAPGKHKTFYGSVAGIDEFANSNVDKAESKADYISSNLEEIYKNNIGDNAAAWSSDLVAEAAKTLDDIATKVGATETSPAQIPVFAYIFTNPAATPAQINANKALLNRLNTLTKKVKFVNQARLAKWNDFVQQAIIHRTYGTNMGGFGPDYPGLGSILQQFLGTDSTGGVLGLFKDILNNPRTK